MTDEISLVRKDDLEASLTDKRKQGKLHEHTEHEW